MAFSEQLISLNYANLTNKPTFDLPIHASASGSVTWTNQPLALTMLNGDHRFRTKYDLTNLTQCRLVINTRAAGTAGSKLIAKYVLTDDLVIANYSDLGATEISCSLAVANVIVASSWINLPSGAKTDVFIAVGGSGGDGATSPIIGSVHLQFK